MTGNRHIVILAMGGASWLGGVQYSKNIALALSTFADDFGGAEVSVLVGDAFSLAAFEPLRPRLRALEIGEAVQAPVTFANKQRWRFQRHVFGAVNPRLDQALQRMGATFAYPLSSREVPSADWISDFQSHTHPDKTCAEDLAMRVRQVGFTARHAMHVVLSSEAIQADCHRRLPSTIGRTSVLRFRSFAEPSWLEGSPAAAIAKYHLPQPYALISNALIPTKNHAIVLEALGRLSPAERRGIHIVCTGDINDNRNPGFYNRFLNRLHELGLREHVFHLGVIPKVDQVQLLRGAAFYLQPSLYEGWNTGVEEARLVGKPVVLSDIAVHREQTPPRTTFFDPDDPDNVAQQLVEAFSAAAARGFDPAAEAAALGEYRHLQRDFAKDLLALASRHESPRAEAS